MRILISHPGLRGDLAINVPALCRIHRDSPDIQIDMPIHKGFADMVPLFLNHPCLNPVIVDGYNDFPTAADEVMLKERGYSRVFNPMQPHRIWPDGQEWHQHCHQTSAVMYDYLGSVLKPADEQIRLVRWFDPIPHDKTVAFAPFAGFASNPNNDKRLSTERAQEIVDYLIAKGWNVLQLGGAGEPVLTGATFLTCDYFTSVRHTLGCRALIHTDTGMGWVVSGYQHCQLGLYGARYYGAAKIGNIQPRNPNGIWLDAPTVADISLDTLTQAIDTLLS